MGSFNRMKKRTFRILTKIKYNFNNYNILVEEHENIPKLPIKTYKWEDVRRSRSRGAYPWTHLTKPPFDEDIDTEEYTMDAFRRSRSSSTLGKPDTQETLPMDDLDTKEDAEKQQEVEKINEVKLNVDTDDNEESVAIFSDDTEVLKQPPILLSKKDKENVLKSTAKTKMVKEKRKLSIGSGLTQISQTKKVIKDKFKDTKAKLKISKSPKRSKSDASEKTSKKTKLIRSTETEYKGKMWLSQPTNESPVYIHIPLKPPPGETDEYSKYEFESPGPSSRSNSMINLQRVGSGRKMSMLALLTEIKKMHDLQQQKLAGESKQSEQQKTEIEKLKLEEPRVQRRESDRLVIEEIVDDDKKSTKVETEASHKPKTPEPIVDEPEDISADDNISQLLDKEDKFELVSEKSTNVSSENISQAGPSKIEQSVETSHPEKVRTFEDTLLKWKKQASEIYPFASDLKTRSVTPTQLEESASDTRRPRARSEEPKRKRKSSVESSYSRKSLSKLAFMKRLKEAKNKFKLSNLTSKLPSFGKTDKKEPKLRITEKPKQTESKKKVEVKRQTETPVYIHIPLKLPPGETDEFSHLAEEGLEEILTKEMEDTKKEPEEGSVPTSPEVPSNDVHLIILTPPSDDEILDSNTPETPSERDQKFFEGIKIDELKHLAKTAVDQVCPDSDKLDTVAEDEGIGERSSPESSQELEVETEQSQRILVDEENALKLSEAAIAMINEELAKELKEQEKEKVQTTKSSLKKKVSFKRKSKSDDGERIYEDVQLSSNLANSKQEQKIIKLPELENFQSMSVDEEKYYLDKKLIKDISLQEDYNKWSISNDHEYEPVNPPSEEIIQSHTITTAANVNLEISQSNNTPPFEKRIVNIPPDNELLVYDENLDDNLSAKEIQKEIEDHFFPNTIQDIASSKIDSKKTTTQVNSSTLITSLLQKEGEQKMTVPVTTSSTTASKDEGPGKRLNEAFRAQAGKIKIKLQGIKKPNITLPQRPKFPSTKLKKPNFKKPNFKMPKMPEKSSITLPAFLTRKDSSKDSWRNRQLSTESNVGDSTKKIFDFRTYPRIFDKYRKGREKQSSLFKDNTQSTPPPPEFATVPRMSRAKCPMGSRWTDQFKNIKQTDEGTKKSKEFENDRRADIIRIPLHPENEDPIDVPSHTRYNEDIDIEDDLDRENRAMPFNGDYLKRWNRGEFHRHHFANPENSLNQENYRITDLDSENVEICIPPRGNSFDIELSHNGKEVHSSGSLSEHRRGVLEEIDSDEFFLREKGISQENIEVGKYLSSEIREAFRNPVNALSQLQNKDREYDLDVSDQSDPIQDIPRRKPLRKPKRKKTPHVSSEQISFDRESVNTEPEEYPKEFDDFKAYVLPPCRPKRKSKQSKTRKPITDDIIPYQETIPLEKQFVETQIKETDILQHNILRDDNIFNNRNVEHMYENKHVNEMEQPEIKDSHACYKYENFQQDFDKFLIQNNMEPPIVPTRRHRSLKSLDISEPDSIQDLKVIGKDVSLHDVEDYRRELEYIIPTPEPPSRPKRVRSQTQSQSGLSLQEDDRTSHEADSLTSDLHAEIVCVEEPCLQDIRDVMGYAVIDKSRVMREPPLPPSRFLSTPPRTRRTKKDKFSTIPRITNEVPPVRPLRNYSTLGGSNRTSRSKSSQSLNVEEKENIDIGQYIEIENGEPVRHLQSGEVIQKMRDRPLPAPPRPPRRPKDVGREVLRDVSHERNISHEDERDKDNMDEVEMSIPTELDEGQNRTQFLSDSNLSEIEKQILTFDHEETVTHASLVVQPIDNVHILSHSDISNLDRKSLPVERIIPVTQESTVSEKQLFNDDEDTSEIPEEFTKLKSPPQSDMIKDNQSYESQQEVRVLKAQKMQVVDLDVDKLRVNELQASKIVVSELDGVSLQISEINSKSGNLVLSGIELPPQLLQEMLDRLQATTHDSTSTTDQSSKVPTVISELQDIQDVSQKKTMIDNLSITNVKEKAPPVPPRYDSKTNLEEPTELEPETELPPIRPPRKISQSEKNCQNLEETMIAEMSIISDIQPDNFPPSSYDTDLKSQLLLPERESHAELPDELPVLPVEPPTSSTENTSKSEEELPPRPPQPKIDYVPSQPPASFFALRSPPYDDFPDEDIPLPPRRKHRHHKAHKISRSSSEESTSAPRRRHRSPEPSIPQLTGQLVRACATEADRALKRLIQHITNNVLQNADGKQDLHVMVLIVLILIAGLILLGGEEKVIIHHHHWEFFNPPTDL